MALYVNMFSEALQKAIRSHYREPLYVLTINFQTFS